MNDISCHEAAEARVGKLVCFDAATQKQFLLIDIATGAAEPIYQQDTVQIDWRYLGAVDGTHVFFYAPRDGDAGNSKLLAVKAGKLSWQADGEPSLLAAKNGVQDGCKVAATGTYIGMLTWQTIVGTDAGGTFFARSTVLHTEVVIQDRMGKELASQRVDGRVYSNCPTSGFIHSFD